MLVGCHLFLVIAKVFLVGKILQDEFSVCFLSKKSAFRAPNNACSGLGGRPGKIGGVQAKAFFRFVGWFSHQATNASRWHAPCITKTAIKIEVETTNEICPLDAGKLIIRIGRFGKFMACENFPTCKFTKPLVEETNLICPKDGAKIVFKKTRKGRRFYGCSNYPNCDFASWKLEDIKKATAESVLQPQRNPAEREKLEDIKKAGQEKPEVK